MDKERILAKIDELNRYLTELRSIKPADLDEYKSSIQIKRASERLLQISIETIIDVCNIIISNLNLGLPSNEDEIFQKLEENKVITKEMDKILHNMKGFRNILVHKYGSVDDDIVYQLLKDKLADFDEFKQQILKVLASK